MWPALPSVGSVEVSTYAVLILAAFGVAWLAAVAVGTGRGVTARDTTDLVLWAALGGLIGGRATYVAANWSLFSHAPWRAFMFQTGGLALLGGLAGGTMAVWIRARLRGLPMGAVADMGAVAIPAGCVVGRIGCFAQGCCAGVATDAWWGVAFPLDGVSRHPTQLYDAAASAVILAVIAIAIRGGLVPEGAGWWVYLGLFALGRFAVESLRDMPELAAGLSAGQWVSIGLTPLAATGFLRATRKGSGAEAVP